MITRIELKNFMSHTHTVIEPAAGLTVLVGPNNVGKSAIVAALQILSHNEKSDYVTRHGEKECSITVKTEDGHSIEWRRKKSPSYVIDGQLFDRLGKGGVPDELDPALRLPNFGDSKDSDFDIHFGTQKSPIFLLDSSAANAAKFFASSSDAIRLVSIQKRHKEKLTDAKKEKNRLESESRLLTAELEHLVPVIEIDQRLRAVETDYEELLELANRIQAAVELERELAAQAKVLSAWDAKALVLKPLVAPPVMQPTETLRRAIAEIQQARATRRLAEALAAALKPLAAPPVLHDVCSLAQLAEHLLSLEKKIELGSSKSALFGQLVEPPELADTRSPRTLIGQLSETFQTIERANRRCEVLKRVPSPPEIQTDARLPELIRTLAAAEAEERRWAASRAALAKLKEPPRPTETAAGEQLLTQFTCAVQHLAACQAEEQTAAKALAAAAEQLRGQAEGQLCPVCGEPFDAERLLATAAADTHNEAETEAEAGEPTHD